MVGLDSNQLDFSGLLGGKVDLRHLQLKQAVFDFLSMPVSLVFNYIGRIRAEIPLYSLMTSPLEVEVEDVLIVLATRPTGEWDAEAFKELYVLQKKGSLESGEFKAMFSAIEGGLLWSTILTLAGNIRAAVRNIHIRIEDWHSRSGNTQSYTRAFSLGLCLKGVVLHSAPRGSNTSEQGFCTSSGKLQDNSLFKVISIEGLGFYIDALDRPLPPGAGGGRRAGVRKKRPRKDGEREVSHAGSTLQRKAKGWRGGSSGDEGTRKRRGGRRRGSEDEGEDVEEDDGDEEDTLLSSSSLSPARMSSDERRKRRRRRGGGREEA